VNIYWGALVVAGAAGVGIAAMLLVRRVAPDGSFFQDGDRAAGVFGVLATGFAILAGFVVFLAFESYDTSRSGAETEARTVAQQFEIAQLMPVAVRRAFSGDLVCYARDVVYHEWPAMQSGSLGDVLNPWGVATFQTLQQTVPRSAAEQAAYSKWLDLQTDRENARADRVHGAEGVIPSPLWVVLFLSAGLIFAFMLFFADPTEPWFVQATMMGGVAIVVTAMLLLLGFLNSPYRNGPGGLRPVAMERTLTLLGQGSKVIGGIGPLPCDATGTPRR
jgi:hypothetical protein